MVEQSLVEQMVELIRDLHADHIKHGAHDYIQDFVARTAAIVSALPKPVDPDLIEAREYYIQACGGLDCDAVIVQQARCGERDRTNSLGAFLSAIKRGRQLQRSLARTDQETAHVR